MAVAVVVAVLAIGVAAFFALRSTRQEPAAPAAPIQQQQPPPTARKRPEPVILSAAPRRPRPVVLDFRQFTDPETRRAYQVARDNPELLEHMPCYCGCYGSNGHTNNLDCFVDRHGEG